MALPFTAAGDEAKVFFGEEKKETLIDFVIEYPSDATISGL